MRLSRPFSILMLALLFASIRVAADDVCEIRPDLCGGPVKGKKVKRTKNYKNETAREADELEREIILEQQERAGKRRAQQQNQGSPVQQFRNAESPSKPLGFSQVQKAPQSHQSMRDFGRKQPKTVDRSTASVFDAYLNSNAQNPALNARMPASQTAFQPAKGSGSTYTNRPDPVTTNGGFNAGQGPYSQTGGFSSKPVTLEPKAPAGGVESSPVSTDETPHDGDGASSAGPLH